MSDKDTRNTKRATKVAIQNLREYTFETDWDIDLHDCTPEQLAPLLRSFYVNARKKNGELAKISRTLHMSTINSDFVHFISLLLLQV